MSDEIKALRKQAMRTKRIASEWASQLHDLVEDRLPAAYKEIPEIAEATYKACEEWEAADKKFQEAQQIAEG